MKKFLRLLCISSFALIPLFSMDKEPKPTDEPKPLQNEITNDEQNVESDDVVSDDTDSKEITFDDSDDDDDEDDNDKSAGLVG